MRFLHLSDLHIGRRLNGFHLLEDQAHVLDQALRMAREADAVLLAGDLYDKAQPSSEAIRMMGFGAGMGLPNINKNSDELKIKSAPDGTRIEMLFHL